MELRHLPHALVRRAKPILPVSLLLDAPHFRSGAKTPDRIAIYQVCGVVERMKYYAIWTLTEVRAVARQLRRVCLTVGARVPAF